MLVHRKQEKETGRENGRDKDKGQETQEKEVKTTIPLLCFDFVIFNLNKSDGI